MFIVFDLDGTLADCEHRVHHITGKDATEKNYDAFYDACVDDLPIPETLDIMRTLIRVGHDVEIWTGRSDRVRKQTLAWLGKQLGQYATDLVVVMRRDGDFTPDVELKRKWLNDHGKPDLVFEDRARMAEMYRAEGIRVYQVDAGDF